MTNKVVLSHDPFGRFSILREVVHLPLHSGATCAWCGNQGRINKTNRTLYRYGNEDDQLYSRPYMEKELFCSKSCHDDYHI